MPRTPADPPTFRITYSGSRQRARHRRRVATAAASFASVATALALVMPSPIYAHERAVAPAARQYARTTAVAMSTCGEWPVMTPRQRLVAAEHLLVALGHADGTLDADDYSVPADDRARRLVDGITARCGTPDADAADMVVVHAQRLYLADPTLRPT